MLETCYLLIKVYEKRLIKVFIALSSFLIIINTFIISTKNIVFYCIIVFEDQF